MLSSAAAAKLGGLSVAVGAWAADAVSTGGTDWIGIAAVIGASGGVITALGTILLGLRTKKDTEKDDAKDELILELLRQQVTQPPEEKPPRKPRKRGPT